MGGLAPALPDYGLPIKALRCSLSSRLLAVSQDLLVLGGKLAVAARFDFALAGKGRHLAQPFDRSLHFPANRPRLQFLGPRLRIRFHRPQRLPASLGQLRPQKIWPLQNLRRQILFLLGPRPDRTNLSRLVLMLRAVSECSELHLKLAISVKRLEAQPQGVSCCASFFARLLYSIRIPSRSRRCRTP
jgi:hypothetical protein